MINDDITSTIDKIIDDYLHPFPEITKTDIDLLIDNTCWFNNNKEGLDCKHFKIINNKLYLSSNSRYDDWETRIEAFKYMILETLKKYKIKDCEFIIYDGDAVNDSNIHLCKHGDKPLPLIVTTSVLDKYNMILCPDFTFSFFPECFVPNNENMCKKIVDLQENIDFKTKIPKLVWRGSANTPYRRQYLNIDENYNVQSVSNNTSYRGEVGSANKSNNHLSREDKSNYKYQLYLNGHNGTDKDGAYSSSFKWALMGKSLVFYSAPAKYREFWNHPLLFKEGEHYVYTSNPMELNEKLNYYIKNDDMGERIANNAFVIFKKYLLKYENVLYYMQKLLNTYSERLTYQVILHPSDRLVEDIMYNEYVFSGMKLDINNITLKNYIHCNLLNTSNIIKLQRYEEYIMSLINNHEKNVVVMRMNMDILDKYDILQVFRGIKNKIIFISSPDIDFPPPKKPYCYDAYFDPSKVPSNYFDINYYDKIHTELIDIIEKNNLFIFSHSISIHHRRLFFIPIGIFPNFDHFHLKTTKKEILCYANFGLAIDRWFGNPRKQVLEIIKHKDFIIKENIEDTHILNRNSLNFHDFYYKIAKSKFAICPRGCGIDTYRLWDCISLGCIPIVEKYDGHSIFSDLPILFINNINDYNNLTEDFLNTKYNEFLSKSFNYSRLTFSSIEKHLRSCQELLETPNFGVYLQCHKNSYATYKCLEALRNFYPTCTVVLLSDNGYDFSEMAKHFGCIYIHENENLWLTYNDLDSGEHINNSMKLIRRIHNAFSLCKEDYVMWLEDDVIINKPIESPFNYDINGFCPNRIQDFSNVELAKTYPFIEINKEYKFSGHGGSIFNKQNILKYFKNETVIMDILKHWRKYRFPADIGQDFLFSAIVTLNQGNIGPYEGHYDGFDRNTIFQNIAVQHQYKRWYGVELPDELKHLVKQ
jgi:hypothetical protein